MADKVRKIHLDRFLFVNSFLDHFYFFGFGLFFKNGLYIYPSIVCVCVCSFLNLEDETGDGYGA